ncbi:hypothetical protein EG68_04092 [Paragonimus skrjabini miyazakii]|uniref:Uncharacterized protein n=1 Tax=Paragonimus skrjabini miyazakii TaxID=59628 RepID=A0A8S9Z4A7_9TREM|nr:hypothetical protein EG68_04092 [Paragonimus skrjabini miyazakii]
MLLTITVIRINYGNLKTFVKYVKTTINWSDEESSLIGENIKFILIGDSLSGKTSVATRFTENTFSTTYRRTTGVDFYKRKILLQALKPTHPVN